MKRHEVNERLSPTRKKSGVIALKIGPKWTSCIKVMALMAIVRMRQLCRVKWPELKRKLYSIAEIVECDKSNGDDVILHAFL